MFCMARGAAYFGMSTFMCCNLFSFFFMARKAWLADLLREGDIEGRMRIFVAIEAPL